jgi:hypothetical protein
MRFYACYIAVDECIEPFWLVRQPRAGVGLSCGRRRRLSSVGASHYSAGINAAEASFMA